MDGIVTGLPYGSSTKAWAEWATTDARPSGDGDDFVAVANRNRDFEQAAAVLERNIGGLRRPSVAPNGQRTRFDHAEFQLGWRNREHLDRGGRKVLVCPTDDGPAVADWTQMDRGRRRLLGAPQRGLQRRVVAPLQRRPSGAAPDPRRRRVRTKNAHHRPDAG